MLFSLSIRNIVIIDKLELSFQAGLCIISGETGAGKSIILDALGLALGRRGDAGLVRKGCRQGAATACFAIREGHPIEALLVKHGLDAGNNEVYLRRLLNEDGRSKAFINDNPVSVSLLSQIANLLIEVHSQHDERGLLQTSGHRDLLDTFGSLDRFVKRVSSTKAALETVLGELEDHKAKIAAARADEDYDRHCLEELSALKPQNNEEQVLSETRTRMRQGERILGDLDEVLGSLTADGGLDAKLRGALRKLERLDPGPGERLEPAREALARASRQIEEGLAALEAYRKDIDDDPKRLEEIEERLFALRALARKHRCRVDALLDVQSQLEEKISQLDSGVTGLAALEKHYFELEQKFFKAVEELSKNRQKAALALDRQTDRELKPLKLERARFRTTLRPTDPSEWTVNGGEVVAFEASTNLGDDFGPLIKIASGGELARFVLALKVVLAGAGSAPTLIFDEVDRGVGGATAAAVGDRLARLAVDNQVIVVTHSPQVAALAEHHWRITKEETGTGRNRTTIASVTLLDEQGRKEELARMLAGARVTDEARAAAARLLEPVAEGSGV